MNKFRLAMSTIAVIIGCVCVYALGQMPWDSASLSGAGIIVSISIIAGYHAGRKSVSGFHGASSKAESSKPAEDNSVSSTDEVFDPELLDSFEIEEEDDNSSSDELSSSKDTEHNPFDYFR